MDKMIDLINQGGTGEYDARQERGEAVAWDMIAMDDLLGAIGRGWCHPANAGKTVDGVLAVAIASEVAQLINSRYAHPTPDAGRVAELDFIDEAAAKLPTDVLLKARAEQAEEELRHADTRIAALEAQLAETKKAYRSMVDANREASEKLAASREREGRMREALEAMLEIHGVTQRYVDTHIEIPQSWVEVSEMARAAAAEKEQTK